MVDINRRCVSACTSSPFTAALLCHRIAEALAFADTLPGENDEPRPFCVGTAVQALERVPHHKTAVKEEYERAWNGGCGSLASCLCYLGSDEVE